MKRRCAWCGIVYGEAAPVHISVTTHGMCAECHQKLVAKIQEREQASNRPAENPSGLTPTVWVTPSSHDDKPKPP
jgi:hypothetical protein